MEAPIECRCCCDDITDENRCMYSCELEQVDWKESLYCIDCVRYIKSSKFHNYIHAIENSDCAKELTGLIKAGPPIWITDGGLPVEEGEHVYWFRNNGEPEAAMYEGAVVGSERKKLWDIIIAAVQPCIDEQLLDIAISNMQLEDE